jgi:hypothetical protein
MGQTPAIREILPVVVTERQTIPEPDGVATQLTHRLKDWPLACAILDSVNPDEMDQFSMLSSVVRHFSGPGRDEVLASGAKFMSAFSVSRFYAAVDVDSAFSQNIESLFNRFIAAKARKTGWRVALQNSSTDAHRATITDPEGIAKSYAIPNGEQSGFSGNLLRQYREYVARNAVAVDDNG